MAKHRSHSIEFKWQVAQEFIAGVWRPWTGLRKVEDREHLLFAFPTTEFNDVVRPIHAKAMAVI
jgi:putative SOS response-associated peptidase YedK